MFKIQKQTFWRLYRYYFKKLFLTWIILTSLILSLLVFLGKGQIPWKVETFFSENGSWKDIAIFSLIRTGVLLQLSISLISLLVQRAKNEDAWILTACSPVNRQSILAAKLATFYTYYFITGLLFTNLTVFSNPLFLIFDWFLLILVNFFLFLTPFFYLSFPARSKIKKFLILALYVSFLLGAFYLGLGFTEANKIVRKVFWNPWIPSALSIFIGPFFLWLLWDNFWRHDY